MGSDPDAGSEDGGDAPGIIADGCWFIEPRLVDDLLVKADGTALTEAALLSLGRRGILISMLLS
jgi:hypothetical protein